MAEPFRLMVTGHRPKSLWGYPVTGLKYDRLRVQLRLALESAVRNHPEGVVAITGMALGVDQMFAAAALTLGIPFEAFVPCANQEGMWPDVAQEAYRVLLSHASAITLCSDQPYAPHLMHARNAAMVNSADACIAVWNGSPTGGTASAVAMARKKNLRLFIYNPFLDQWTKEVPHAHA